MKAEFSVTCTAVYDTSLDIPDKLVIKNKNGNITKESQNAIAAYIQEHLDDCDVSNLEWVTNDDEFGGDVTITDNNDQEETFFVDYP